MAWWHAVVEARHDIQNPISPEKIRLLGERLLLGPESDVLDLASGRGGPALVLARAFGCHLTCVEMSEEFVTAARERVRQQDLEARIDIVHADARAYVPVPARHDAALCLGATFIWGGLENTIAHLSPAVRDGGSIAVGEPYWRARPLPRGYAPDEHEDFATLAETAARFEATGVDLVTMIVSSPDDWDAYETLHWLALEDWLHQHPDGAESERFRAQGARQKERYLRWERDLLGWVILVGRPRRPVDEEGVNQTPRIAP